MSTMYSKVTLAGHPVHPMLVVFPVTFYTTTLLGFLAYALTGNLFWWRVGLWSNVAGVIMAAIAALPGLVDYTGIPGPSPAKVTARRHLTLNVAALSAFAINLVVQRDRWPLDLLRTGLSPSPGAAIALSALGFLLTLGAGFLGWTLVQTHHVGVSLSEEQQRLEPTAEPRARPITPR